MSQASPTQELPQADHLKWEEIEEIAGQLFHIWVDGGDLAWAKSAWQALSQAGMTAYTTEAERTTCVVRLIALSALYWEFYVRAFDGGSSGEWQELITSDLVGGYPKLNASALGQLAGWLGNEEDDSPLYDSDPSVLQSLIVKLVYDEYRSIVDTLQGQWGGNAFFTSLWVSAEPDQYEDDEENDEGKADPSISPVTSDQIVRVMNYGISGSKGSAYSWFADGLPL
jgi:hypothetical protein